MPMGCCNSTANDPSPDMAAEESMPPPSARSRESVAEDSSSTFPQQQRSRTPPARLPTHGGEMTPSPEVLRRVMSESAPQLPSPSSNIRRTNSVQAGSFARRRQVLTSTVQQVLSNPSHPLKYVARFWFINRTLLIPP